MYFKGTIGLDLAGTELQIRKPSRFFGRIANKITGGRFETQEERETYRIMSLAQGINKALFDLGINNIIRLAIDDNVIYEDKEHKEDDYKAAMDKLECSDVDPAGFDLNELDIICEHTDDAFHYIIDFDIFRFHKPGKDPITVNVTAIPTRLRRKGGETNKSLENRVESIYRNEKGLNQFKAELEAKFKDFMDLLNSNMGKNLGIEVESDRVDVKTCLPQMTKEWHYIKEEDREYKSFGPDLIFYVPWSELYYLHFVSEVLYKHGDIRINDIYFVPLYGGLPIYYGDAGISGTEYGGIEASLSEQGTSASFDAGGSTSDSGGGGWLSNVGFFSSDSGGGGDVGGPSCGSSCGSSCGGGCGG